MLPPVKIADTEIGRMLLFDGPDGINRTLLTHGRYEALNLMIARTLIKMNRKPGAVLDGGANLGAFTVPLARDFAASHRVYAFEAQRVVFCQLCANVALNRLDNVYPHLAALSDADGALEIPEPDYAVDANVGAVSVDPAVRRARAEAGRGCATDAPQTRTTRVPAAAFDSLGVNDLRFVKLDVEGHEAPALRGMTETLKRSAWPSLMMEAWDDRNVPAFVRLRADLIGLSESLGYETTELGELVLAQHRSRPTLLRLSLEADGVTVSGKEETRGG